MRNKYMNRSRISEAKFRQVVRLFSLDIEAKKTAILTGLNRNSVNALYSKIRIRIAQDCQQGNPLGKGEIELDESYFGPKRVRGRRGRGAGGKIPVFGMLKREGKVYTQVIKNCSIAEIVPIIEQQADKESTIYTDGFKTYDGLADFGYKTHYRIKHSTNEFAKGRNHINGIENFWGLCKVRLTRFRGIHKHTFYLHLKECEFRFNNKDKNLYIYLLKLLKKYPLN